MQPTRVNQSRRNDSKGHLAGRYQNTTEAIGTHQGNPTASVRANGRERHLDAPRDAPGLGRGGRRAQQRPASRIDVRGNPR